MGKSAFALALLLLAGPVGAESFPAKWVYEKAAPAVPFIMARNPDSPTMLGSGFFVDPSGHILTCAHVVIDRKSGQPFKEIQVALRPRKMTGALKEDLRHRRSASVVDFDRDLDLALLKMETSEIPAALVPLADPSGISVGEEVVAIGHPEQGGPWSLTAGRISGQMANQGNVKGKDVFQTDANLNRGNSGGPLLDRRGYAVGVNANIARQSGDGLTITGVNFTIKASVVLAWMQKVGITVSYGPAPLDAGTGGEEGPFTMVVRPFTLDEADAAFWAAEKDMDDTMDSMRRRIRR